MNKKNLVLLIGGILVLLIYGGILGGVSYEIVGLASYYDIEGDYSIDFVYSITVSNDGNYLFTSSSWDDYVSIMNISNKSEIVGLASYYDIEGDYSVESVQSILVSSDGNYLFTSSYADSYVSIMNISNKSEIVGLATYNDTDGEYSVEELRSFAISPDGNYLFTSSSLDDYVSIMNVTNKSEIVGLASYHDTDGDYSVDSVQSIVVSSDGNYLFTSSFDDDYVSIMNVTDKTQILPLATYNDSDGDYSVDGLYSLAVSSDGNYLFTSSDWDDYVSIMNISNKSEIVGLATYHDTDGEYSVDGLYSFAVSNDGNYLFTSSIWDDCVSIMDITDKTQILPLATYTDIEGEYSVDQVYSIAISPDGNYLFTSSYADHYVSIMQLDTINPNINITFPINNTNWTINTIDVNYTASDNLNLDSCWYSNDTYSVNTSLESCETNITNVVWTEGQHNVTVWANDTWGNENYSRVTFFIDTLGPAITIVHPKAQAYSTNESLSLNQTIIDVTLEVDDCWFKIVNSTGEIINITGDTDVLTTNTTLTNCQNTTFNVSRSDTYTLTLYANDTLGNEDSSFVTFSVSLEAPAIVLDAPTDNEYLNNGTNIYFNFTAIDGDDLDTCELWGNWTGTWHNNYTWVGPETAVMNHTTQNISGDNLYKWNIWCNDTLDNNDFALNNFTFTLDTIYPNITINSITTTAGTQTFDLNSTEQDLNLDECFYSIFDSTGAIDGINENVSYTCGVGQSHSATTTAYGTFNLTIYAIDLASNENSTTRSFTTSPITPPPPAGGGGVTVIEGVIAIEAVNFTITTTNFKNQMDISLAKDSEKPRTKEFYITNMGIEPIEIEVVCDTQDVNESTKEIDICDYVTFSSTNFTVSPNIEERSLGTFELETPPNSSIGDIYYFNILAVRKIGEETRYSKLSVKSTVSLWAMLIKWSSFPVVGQAVVDGEEPRKIIYPVVVPALAIAFGLFLAVFLFLRWRELYILGFFLGLTAGIGSFILFLFIL